MANLTDEQLARARELRRSVEPSERRMWTAIRDVCPEGLRIRRQHRVLGFYLDFYCIPAKLALEVDGRSHEKNEKHDSLRDAILLNQKEILTLHVKADDVQDDAHGIALRYCKLCLERIEGLN
jgi:very-short-patch-repair endonuclease